MFNFDGFYMFRTRGFIFRKTIVIPYCCFSFVPRLFYAIILVHLVCLMGSCEFYFFRTAHFNIIMPYKPTKCTFSKIIFKFLILMTSICFEPDGSSSGRRLFRKDVLYWFMLYNYITVHGAQNIKLVIYFCNPKVIEIQRYHVFLHTYLKS